MAIRLRRIVLFSTATCTLLFLFWRLQDRFLDVALAREHVDQGTSSYYYQPRFGIGPGHLLNPVSSYIPLPTATRVLPRIQHDFKAATSNAGSQTRLARLEVIKEAMMHSWRGYREKAWLMDELSPVTGGSRKTLGGWSVSLVDALDTLWLMGMTAEFEEAVTAVADIDFTTATQLPINVFETTIRYLGGLIGAYDVSRGKYPILLDKARELGDMLYEAFDTQNHMPVTKWSRIGPGIEAPNAQTLIAELGTLSLEFTRLTQLTGDPRYYDAVQRVTDCLESQQNQTRFPGLFPHIVNARDCYFFDGVSFSLGGSADSVYEYFSKEYQLLAGGAEQYRKLYEIAKDPIKNSILFRPMTPTDEDILLAGTVKAYRPGNMKLIPQTQHLACFAGGMFALGAKIFNTPEDIETAEKLVRGCIWAYGQTATGIMPEMFHAVPCSDEHPECPWDEQAWGEAMFELNTKDESPEDKLLPHDVRVRQKSQRLRFPKGISAIANREYALRPEALESIFVLYRITGDESLRESAWHMFEAIMKQTRTEYGFSCIEDVTQPESKKTDKMESFWMAETLKYMWLLFEDPNVLSLDEFVFNTEAHPFRLATRG
jgi:mannosyl-oligosaccharide alpha-1,2-mannosidase